MPQDIKYRLESNQIPMTRALALEENRRKREKACLGLQILEDGRAIVGEL
ncbi:MAG: hypothetical protein KKC26_01140 [Nanoarchaeota archaeon]|nr:hypothetical protein [Nanoarchaeota archaeon]